MEFTNQLGILSIVCLQVLIVSDATLLFVFENRGIYLPRDQEFTDRGFRWIDQLASLGYLLFLTFNLLLVIEERNLVDVNSSSSLDTTSR